MIQKAGSIIVNAERDAVVLLYRAKQNDWSFPKGHIEPGEDAMDAFMREVKEETGLDVSLIRELQSMKYLNNSGEKIEVKMYLAEGKKGVLKTEFEGDKLEWVLLGNVVATLTHNNLKEYFKSVQPLT